MTKTFEPIVTYSGVEQTEGINTYLMKRLDKILAFLKDNSNIKVNFKSETQNKAIHENIMVNIHVNHGSEFIEVKENGFDLYQTIDKATDTLRDRLKKLKEKNIRHKS